MAPKPLWPDPVPVFETYHPIMVEGAWLRTPYGVPGPWAAGFHTGDDWNVGSPTPAGIPILAVAHGTVTHVGYGGWGPAYGWQVHINWDGSDRVSMDAHMPEGTRYVRVGQKVEPGQRIGSTGATGNTTGVHDHHEQRIGRLRYGTDAKRPIYPNRRQTGWQ